MAEGNFHLTVAKADVVMRVEGAVSGAAEDRFVLGSVAALRRDLGFCVIPEVSTNISAPLNVVRLGRSMFWFYAYSSKSTNSLVPILHSHIHP